MLAHKNSTVPSVFKSTSITLSGIKILILRKNIKNINFSVSSKDAQVRVSAPINLNDEIVISAIHAKLGWIQNSIEISKHRIEKSKQNFNNGEKLNFLGNQYTLKLIEQARKPSISIDSSGIVNIRVRKNATTCSKEALLKEWYRAELKQRIPLLIEKWQPIVGEKVSEWGVKKMKTRWGTCNINKKRIWLNLELAKQPEECLEYVVVHEMTHLLERKHNARFKELLDGFIPDWKKTEAILNINSIKR